MWTGWQILVIGTDKNLWFNELFEITEKDVYSIPKALYLAYILVNTCNLRIYTYIVSSQIADERSKDTEDSPTCSTFIVHISLFSHYDNHLDWANLTYRTFIVFVMIDKGYFHMEYAMTIDMCHNKMYLFQWFQGYDLS